MKKEPIQSFIKTECGLSEYHLLKMRANNSVHDQALQKLKDVHGETPLITNLKYTVLGGDQF